MRDAQGLGTLPALRSPRRSAELVNLDAVSVATARPLESSPTTSSCSVLPATSTESGATSAMDWMYPGVCVGGGDGCESAGGRAGGLSYGAVEPP